MDEPIRILIVEDNAKDRKLMHHALGRRAKGLQIEDCSTLRVALEAIPSGRFTMILLDLGLPDSHGEATIRAVCEAARPTGADVVIYSVEKDPAMIEVARRAGAMDFVSKSELLLVPPIPPKSAVPVVGLQCQTPEFADARRETGELIEALRTALRLPGALEGSDG